MVKPVPKLDEDTRLAVAEKALVAWDFQATQIEHIATSENTVFRVDADDGGTYALRIHRPGYHTLSELNAELQWTEALNEAGVDVPKPQLTQEGLGYATVSIPNTDEIRHVGIVEWIDGVPLAKVMKETDDQQTLIGYYDQLGQITAQIHNQAVNWQIPKGFQRHAFDADGFMGAAPFWGPFWEVPQLTDAERKLILQTRSAIHRTLSEYGKQKETYSLIHADLHAYNLLVSDNRLYAIDFDDSGFGWHQYDMAVALYNTQDEPNFEAIRDTFISSYRSLRVIEDSAIELLPMFLLIRPLALLGWLYERPEFNSGERIKRLIALACKQAETFLK